MTLRSTLFLVLEISIFFSVFTYGQNLPGTNPNPDPQGLAKAQEDLNKAHQIRFDLQRAYQNLRTLQYRASRSYPSQRQAYQNQINQLSKTIQTQTTLYQNFYNDARTLVDCYLIHSIDAYKLRGQVLMMENNFKKAQEDFTRYLQSKPRDSWALYTRGICLLNLMEWERSYQDISRALSMGFQPPRCYNNMIKIRFNQGRIDEALALYEKMLPLVRSNPKALASLQNRIEKMKQFKKAWEAEEELCQKETARKDLPRVKLLTNKGAILLELFEDHAPNTVANFISLVERKFYDSTRFHRVVLNYYAQGGDPSTKGPNPSTDGKGGPGYLIPDEIKGNPRRHFRGYVAMAAFGPNQNGSQFYFTFVPCPRLDGRFTVFGRVVQGMETLDKIRRGDRIISGTVVRKRNHPYVPKVQRQ